MALPSAPLRPAYDEASDLARMSADARAVTAVLPAQRRSAEPAGTRWVATSRRSAGPAAAAPVVPPAAARLAARFVG